MKVFVRCSIFCLQYIIFRQQNRNPRELVISCQISFLLYTFENKTSCVFLLPSAITDYILRYIFTNEEVIQ